MKRMSKRCQYKKHQLLWLQIVLNDQWDIHYFQESSNISSMVNIKRIAAKLCYPLKQPTALMTSWSLLSRFAPPPRVHIHPQQCEHKSRRKSEISAQRCTLCCQVQNQITADASLLSFNSLSQLSSQTSHQVFEQPRVGVFVPRWIFNRVDIMWLCMCERSAQFCGKIDNCWVHT